MKYIFSIVVLFSIATLWTSCEKMPDKSELPNSVAKKVWIVNEGNFQFGNSSLDVYFPDSQTVFKNVYETANNKKMGDVAQTAVFRDKQLFTVVNNSAKIVVVNTDNYKELYTISLTGSSPRYLHFVSANKAFVTELYANKIWVINPAIGTLLDTISAQGWTEQMAQIDNNIFITQRARLNGTYVANLLVIDASTNKILQTISLPSEPNSLAQIGKYIYVMCEHSSTSNAKLVCVDATTKSVVKTWEFMNGSSPFALRSNAGKNELYWLNNGVFRMIADVGALPASAFISGNNRNLYALNINPLSDEIYVSDAVDYVQSSSVFRYKANGDLIQTFKTGIITNSFIFE